MPNGVTPGVTITDKLVTVGENEGGPHTYDALAGVGSEHGGSPNMWRFTNVEGFWNTDPMADEYGITWVAGQSGTVNFDNSKVKYQVLGDETFTYRFYFDVQFDDLPNGSPHQAGTGYFDIQIAGVNHQVDIHDLTGAVTDTGNFVSDYTNFFLLDDVDDEELYPVYVTAINGAAVTSAGGSVDGLYGRLVWQNQQGNVTHALDSDKAAALDPGETYVETFTYTVTDSKNAASTSADGTSDTASIKVTITGKDDAIKLLPDSFETNENDGPRTFDVLENDVAIDHGDTKTITSWSIRQQNGISGNSGLTFSFSDISIALVNNKFNVDFGESFRQLAEGQYASFLIDYTVDDGHGTTSTTYAGFTAYGLPVPVVTEFDTHEVDDTAPVALIDVLANDIPRDNAITMQLVGARADGFYTTTSNVFDQDDVDISIVDGKVRVDLGEDFKKLTTDQVANFYVEYTVLADSEEVTGFLYVIVHGTDATPIALEAKSDTGAMAENAAPKSFKVLDNDTVTPALAKSVTDVAVASVQMGAGLDAGAFAALGITTADVTVAIVNNQVKVTLGDDFKNLSAGQSVEVKLNYTAAAGTATDDGVLTVTVSGANTTIKGSGADNTLNGTLGIDSILGLGGADELYGLAGKDTLDGGKGSDFLDGGTGDDSMTGGEGNDVFAVDSVGDKVIEDKNGGLDGIRSTISLTGKHHLADNVEIAFLDGTANLKLDGNALANALTGNDGNNKINGADGNDTIDGGGGNDTMGGGKGNDVYVFDSTGDKAKEAKNQGTDTVLTSVDMTDANRLAANIENAEVTSGLNVGLEGNTLNNKLSGNDGINAIRGGDGKDTIYGGGGVDSLTGDNPGGKKFADLFVYKATTDSLALPLQRDVIFDFGKGDKLDVHLIDAIEGGKDQKFKLDTGGAFSAGEIRQTLNGTTLTLDFNTDNDAEVEMSIILAARSAKLVAADFVL